MNKCRQHRFLTKPFSVIGHRGAAGHAAENSLQAFEVAFAAHVDAIECDVKSIHGRLLVFHDDSVDRLTNGSGLIDRLTQTEIDNLRLSNGEGIPTLADVWDIVPPNVGINIELKGPGTGLPVAEFVRSHSHQYIVSSFIANELKAFSAHTPEVPTALLARQYDEDIIKTATALHVDNIHIIDSVATSKHLEAMVAAGFTVYVFTVNSLSRAFELREDGATAIFTDVPQEINRTTIPYACGHTR